MKRVLVSLAAIAVIMTATAGGCDTTEGSKCDHKGSTKTVAKTHKTYHCKYDPQLGGNTWQKES